MPRYAPQDNTTCVICKEELFPGPYGLRTDKAWDETRCWPHDDPTKQHVTMHQIYASAKTYWDAPSPVGVTGAMMLILWYEYNAPDHTPEAATIDHAVILLSEGMELT
jgi:hypothetical protein